MALSLYWFDGFSLPEEIFLAKGTSSSDKTLVNEMSSTVGAFQAFCMPGPFQHFENESVHDKAIATSAARNCC